MDADMEQTKFPKTEDTKQKRREEKESKIKITTMRQRTKPNKLENTVHSYEIHLILDSYCLLHAMRMMMLKFQRYSRYYCHDSLCVAKKICEMMLSAACTRSHCVFSTRLLSCHFPSIIIFRLVCSWWWYGVDLMTSFSNVIILYVLIEEIL